MGKPIPGIKINSTLLESATFDIEDCNIKELIIPIEKALDTSKLVKKLVSVTHNGKTYQAMRWMRPSEAASRTSREPRDSEGYFLAPNGEPSYLNEKQWHQVRTPEFKKWFGDWEIADLKDNMRRIRGSEQVKALKKELVGRPLKNRDTGIMATISGESFRKMMSYENVKRSVSPQAHYQALGNLDKLFPLAVLSESRSGKKENDAMSINSIHHFEIPMPFDDDVYMVKIMAKEFLRKEQGTRLYLVEAVEIKEPASLTGLPVNRSAHRPAGYKNKIAHMISAVNPNSVSKIVDENGEPLVVYKGMMKNDWRTGKEIESIDSPNGQWAGFFTDRKDVAEKFQRVFSTMGEAVLHSVYLSIQNPYVYDANGALARDVMFDDKVFGKNPTNSDALAAFNKEYDGVIIKNTEDEGTIYVPKNPNQIKSINANEFDPSSPNFNKSLEGRVWMKENFAVPIEKSLTFSGWKLQGRRKVQGMNISIENKKGSVRHDVDKDGHKWASKMHADYGYIRETVGKDKDHLDVYCGPNPESTKVFIIHQNDPTTGRYDEDKIMLGFDSAEEAKALYMKQYDRPGFFGSMDETDIETFKKRAFADSAKGKKLVIKSHMNELMRHVKDVVNSTLGSYTDLGLSSSERHVFDGVVQQELAEDLEQADGKKVRNGTREELSPRRLGVKFYTEEGLHAGKPKAKEAIGGLREPSRQLEDEIERKYPKELGIGIQVEKEHTDDPETAKIIAMAHIKETPDYYTKLIAAGLVDEPEAIKMAKKIGIVKALPKAGDVENSHQSAPKGYPKEKKEYADPNNYKYPLDTAEHVRAAISYFSKPTNFSVYSPSERRAMWTRIVRAAQRHGIEVGEKDKFHKSFFAISFLAKARDFSHLVKRPVYVHRQDGTVITQMRYVRSGDDKAAPQQPKAGENTSDPHHRAEQVARLLNPDYQKRIDKKNLVQPSRDMNELYRLAEDARAGFRDYVNAAAKKLGAIEVQSRKDLKDRDRVEEKMRNDRAMDASQIYDFDGHTLIFDGLDSLAAAVEFFMADPRVMRLKNNFAMPSSVGYRDINMNVKLPNGMISEVQLTTRAMAEAKSEGHVFYEVWRELQDKPENDKITRLIERAQIALYQEAWAASKSPEAFASRRASSFEIARPFTIKSARVIGDSLSELSEKTRKHFREALSRANGTSSRSKKSISLESMLGISKPSIYKYTAVTGDMQGASQKKIFGAPREENKSEKSIHYVLPFVIRDRGLQKAKKSSRLVPVKKTVVRNGHTYSATYWILPEQVSEFQHTNLFEERKPISAQLDLFDQPLESEKKDNPNATQGPKLNKDHIWINADEKKLVIKTPLKTDSNDDLDPSSPNYKYRDTGYIAGSRKELAAERIKMSSREGKLVRFTDIDWGNLEENPRKAHEIITKSNLFGQVNWDELKAEGMEPGAGYLIDRVYASIGKEPENSPESRKDYSNGIESIRNRLETCKTVDDVIKAVDDIDGEMRGEMLNATESKEYQELSEKTHARWLAIREKKDKADAMANEVQKIERQKYPLQSEISKRKNHGWKVDPAMVQRVVEIEQEAQEKRDEYIKFRDKYPAYFKTVTRDRGNGRTGYTTDEEEALHIMNDKLQEIKKTATARNLLTNPITRAWLSLGPRFQSAINYKHYNGSDSFGNHIATARSGRIKDWSWAEREHILVKKATKQSVNFQLRVADKFERKGGRNLGVDSTETLKQAFGLRDVQSGNWVLEDVNSAKFHTESAAAAFADLADILGIADTKISLNGRLALAFGARGNGAKGWAGGAPRAHYEPIERIINITKMGGGGCLAHEWWHSFDNMIAEAAGIDTSKEKTFFSTENPERLKNQPELQKAVQVLSSAITQGAHRATTTFAYTDMDYKIAQYNIEGKSLYNSSSTAAKIKNAGSAQNAIDIVMKMYSSDPSRREKKNRDTWIRIAAAWYGGNANGGEVEVEHGPSMSSFMLEAKDIDGERKNAYWSTTHEMAARAFQSWCEDRLASMDRRNDYLSIYADNKYYHNPIFGDRKPFPEGEERKRIDAAFDRLFDVIRSQDLIQKAITFENRRRFRKIRLWTIS